MFEDIGGGNDTVSTSVSYALAAGQEVETIRVTDAVSTGALNINGNAFNQTIIGNDGANVLNGGGGGDVLSGLGGNDRYFVTSSGDRVLEAAGKGADTVFTTVSLAIAAGQEIERISVTDASSTTAVNLNGNEFAQKVTGNDGANALNGGAGNDVIYGLGDNDRLFGGLGKDLLTGGAGNDLFFFNTGLSASNVDVIADFSNLSGDNDTIYLDDAVFTALTPGALGGAFVVNTDGVAQNSGDRIIYESDTGKLFYDADGTGNGTSVLVASLTGHPTLTASDFVVF